MKPWRAPVLIVGASFALCIGGFAPCAWAADSDPAVRILPAKQLSSNEVWIVAAEHVVSNPAVAEDYAEPGASAAFRVTGRIYGVGPTGIITVVFEPFTLRAPLPDKAILILTRFHRDIVFEALAGEAWRGILSDTAENRSRLAITPVEDLLHTPLQDEIAINAALDLGRAKLDELGMEASSLTPTAYRYDHGWKIAFAVAEGTAYRDVVVTISDAGYVLRIARGWERYTPEDGTGRDANR